MSLLRQTKTDSMRHMSCEAAKLVAILPHLMLEARRASAVLSRGIHGRRTPGTGENFWQYRQINANEPTQAIDWRRSARDRHLYVREREWEAAHTIWIWMDRSPSMAFASHLAPISKLERMFVIAFALADILVRGGERVGVPDLLKPVSSRNIIEKIAQKITLDETKEPDSLPLSLRSAPGAEFIWLSDCLSAPGDIRKSLKDLSTSGFKGHIVQILDPAEEAFPYTGRLNFIDPETGETILAANAAAWREDYQKRLAAHRATLRDEAKKIGWSFIVHHTDRPASELLLALHARINERRTGGVQ